MANDIFQQFRCQIIDLFAASWTMQVRARLIRNYTPNRRSTHVMSWRFVQCIALFFQGCKFTVNTSKPFNVGL